MRNRAAVRRRGLTALDIQMNPLMITGGIGKLLHTLLGNGDPVRNRNFLSGQLFQLVQCGDDSHGVFYLSSGRSWQ